MTWTLTFHIFIQDMAMMGTQMRSSVVSVVYRKAMRLSNTARKSFTVGEITNYMSVDAQRIIETIPFIHHVWSAPYMIVLAIYFLYQELGPCAFAGFGALLVLVPFNVWAMKKTEKLQESQLAAKDERIKLINEALSGMKVLKLYGWEMPFMRRISDVRDKEVGILRTSAYLWSVINCTFAISPFLVTVVIFAVYVATDPINHVLTAEKIFVSIALFNLIRIPLILFPYSIFEIIKLLVSMRRINKFINADDLDPDTVSDKVRSEGNAIELREATLDWGRGSDNNDNESSHPATLRDLNLEVPKNSLIAVVGVVGAGKSSLLSGMLGEMRKVSGEINVEGSIAYVPQQAWIQNLTLKKNILFNSDYRESKYNRVLDSCALRPDLEILSAGDQTEIGENGINLSGGQKQRVSLARAVYSESDIYLLDDPLSAVDAHVGKHIFEQVISSETGCLKDKTRILVTHSIGFLEKVDQIWVVKKGLVAEIGSYDQLMANKGAFSEFLMHYRSEMKSDKTESRKKMKRKVSTSSGGARSIPMHRTLSSSMHSGSPRSFQRQISIGSFDEAAADLEVPPVIEEVVEEVEDQAGSAHRQPLVPQERNSDGQLIEEEVALVGRVKWSVYLKYCENIGFPVALFCIFLYMVGQGLQVGANVWLSQWADKNGKNNGSSSANNTFMYLGVYAGIGFGAGVAEVLKELILFLSCVYASKVIHERLLGRIFKSPMSFFDTNPSGRVVNRFSADIDTVDQTIPFQLTDFFYCSCEVMAVIAVISYSTPLFMTVFVPIFIGYFFIQRYYISTSRQLKRLESIRKSPIFSHFSESVTGVSTIRAYKHQSRFCSESEDKVANNVQCFYLCLSSNRWLGTRIESIGNLIVLFASVFAIAGRASISPGLAGLSITYSLSIVDALNWLVRMLCDLETNSVAIERILEYSNNTQEAEWEKPEEDGKLPSEWPEQGAIKFENYQTRYREGLDLVLKGIDMEIDSKEKIGICGRTGAGKSSLTMALFRIIESTEGRITIDGHDISKLGLLKLRSCLTIIPQDPVLFTGDLRFNLDPTNHHTDEEIWWALDHAHLKRHVTDLSDGLGHEVNEGGENFSVGQRQ
jgi:ATP-binding cassette subfamily C (CFTR/MRP) protein 1